MSYLKMLGLARGKLPGGGAAGLFSTAVISGSSSAPNLRVMIPATSASNTALEGFGGVPAIRPLETLHNALSLRQLDKFLECVTCAPVLLGTPPALQTKQPSPTNSVGWSGPSSLMSSSGELPSALSSAGPSSPNSNYASNSDHKNSSECSNWSRSKLPAWDGEAATLCALETGLRPYLPQNLAGSSISGDVTPVSIASELEFNSNDATAGSITDHELMSGEDDEETLSIDQCVARSDASFQPLRLDCQPSTSSAYFYLEKTEEALNKEAPSSSTFINLDIDKTMIDLNNIDHKEDKSIKTDILNKGIRRYSEGSAQKNTPLQVASRFTTTPVAEETLRPCAGAESKSYNTLATVPADKANPLITKAKSVNVKPGFNIADG